MAKLYKLTDEDGLTRDDTEWGPGVSHSGTGEGELCGPGWIHGYEHPLIAMLMNPIHADVNNPRMWEAEGEIGLRDGQLKCGCKTLTTIRELPVPEITTEMRVRFAILCAREVAADAAWKKWNAWTDKWLSGEDRSEASASAAVIDATARARAEAATRLEKAMWSPLRAALAARAAARAEGARAEAATGLEKAVWSALRAALASKEAAFASKEAALAAEASRETGVGTDIFAIAEKACSGLRNFA